MTETTVNSSISNWLSQGTVPGLLGTRAAEESGVINCQKADSSHSQTELIKGHNQSQGTEAGEQGELGMLYVNLICQSC